MTDRNQPDSASSILARRALLVTLSLTLMGALSGVFAVRAGMVQPHEVDLVVCSFLFSFGTLVTLLAFRNIALQTVATISTSFLALNVGAGMVLAVYDSGEHLNFFVYLLWTFPLLVFNRLVNQPAVARLLARILLIGPLLLILCLAPKWLAVLNPEQKVLLMVYCISFCCFALTLNFVTRYREKYIVECERVESLKIETELLESISDCFISLDTSFRLIYLNDAACAEFAVERQAALNDTLAHAAPGFLSKSMEAELHTAITRTDATIFEAQNQERSLWYDLRCFPRPDGMSIYFRDITSRKTDEARIQHLAFYDVLTGLPNRQLLRDNLGRTLAATTAIGALLYIDLDDFKTLNDTMGHDIGDLLLQQVTQRLTACVERGDTVARLGGDEFIIMLEGLGEDPETGAASARSIGNRILKCLLPPFTVGTYEIETTASIGATLFSGALDTVDELLKRTDLAMYGAKAQGRNAICFFDPVMQTDVDARAALRADLRSALQNDEFQLHYQPQVNSNGTVTGSEALLRWHHPLRGNVPPSEFVPLAEEAGLIVELGHWVLKTACRQLAIWAAMPSMESLTLSANVSIRQFLDPQFVNLLREALQVSGANPHRLKLEVTESLGIENVGIIIAKMQTIKAYGVGFSLDDFGTGYSSLSHLSTLPLDQLKIDRGFVRNVLTDPRDASIARAIIMLGHSLDLSVIAEGVETSEQRDFLKAEGCHLYQGFLYSPALTATKFEAFVAMSTSEISDLLTY